MQVLAAHSQCRAPGRDQPAFRSYNCNCVSTCKLIHACVNLQLDRARSIVLWISRATQTGACALLTAMTTAMNYTRYSRVKMRRNTTTTAMTSRPHAGCGFDVNAGAGVRFPVACEGCGRRPQIEQATAAAAAGLHDSRVGMLGGIATWYLRHRSAVTWSACLARCLCQNELLGSAGLSAQSLQRHGLGSCELNRICCRPAKR